MPRKGEIKKEINWDLVELYVKSGCKQVDICEAFYIDECTLRKRVMKKYGVSWAAFSASLLRQGELLLLAKGYQKAMSGHWAALQWFLQVRCGQKIPENSSLIPHNQNNLDQSHIIMQQAHRIAELEANDYNKPEAKQELLGSDTPL